MKLTDKIEVSEKINKNEFWSQNDMNSEEIKKAIIKQIQDELAPSDNRIKTIQVRLNKASLSELERIYNAFSRFGVQAIMESVK